MKSDFNEKMQFVFYPLQNRKLENYSWSNCAMILAQIFLSNHCSISNKVQVT